MDILHLTGAPGVSLTSQAYTSTTHGGATTITNNYCRELQRVAAERALLLRTLERRVDASQYQISIFNSKGTKRKSGEPHTSSSTTPAKRSRWTTQLPSRDQIATEIPPPPIFAMPSLISQTDIMSSTSELNTVNTINTINTNPTTNTTTNTATNTSRTTTTNTTTDNQQLSPELTQRAQHLNTVFRTKNGETMTTKQKREIASVMKEVVTLYSDVIVGRGTSGRHTSRHFDQVCDILGLEKWSEESIHGLCTQLVVLGLSHDNTLTFVRRSLLPRVVALDRPASRTLVNMTIELAVTQPRAVVDGILLPSLLRGNGQPCNKATVELVSRVAKSLSTEYVTKMIGRLVGVSASHHESNVEMTITPSDSTLTLFKTLLSIKRLSLPPSPHVDLLIQWFDACLMSDPTTMSKSIKLASAIHAMIKTHATKDHVGRIEPLVGRMTGMMTKTCATALRKIKK